MISGNTHWESNCLKAINMKVYIMNELKDEPQGPLSLSSFKVTYGIETKDKRWRLFTKTHSKWGTYREVLNQIITEELVTKT